MAAQNIVVVNIEMPNGTLHGPIQLHPLTNEDVEEIEYVLGHAQNHGRYDIVTQTIQFNALGGSNLYWEGLGARDRFDFEEISPGLVVQGTLYWSNPLIDVQEKDDLESQCLCQDGFSCPICRLQRRVQHAETSRYESEQERDTEAAELDEIAEEHNDLLEDFEHLQAENKLLKDKMENLKGYVAEVSKKNSKLTERNSELLEENSRLMKQIRHLSYKNQKPINHMHGSISKASEIDPNDGSNQAASGKIDSPKTFEDTYETVTEDVNFQSTSLHDQHTSFFPAKRQRGGKYRDNEDANFHGEPIKRKRAVEGDKLTKGLEPSKKRHKYSMPAGGMLEEGGMNDALGIPIQNLVTVTKDESEKSQPALKHYNSVTQLSSNTTKVKEKKIGLNRSYKIDGDSHSMLPKSTYPLVNHPPSKSGKGTHPSQKVNGRNFGIERKVEKKRPYESDNDDDEDDDFNPDAKRRRCFKAHTSNLKRGTMSTKPIRGSELAGRATNNSRSSFLDEMGHGTSQDIQSTTNTARVGRSTNNSLAHFLDDHSSVTIPGISQINVSNASTGSRPPANSLPPHIHQPSLVSSDSCKSTGWTDRERQAFIELMNIQVNHTPEEDRLHDVHLYEFMSTQLRQRYGINRNPGACKNEWSRRLRIFTGIDERKVKNPRKLATSVQAAGS